MSNASSKQPTLGESRRDQATSNGERQGTWIAPFALIGVAVGFFASQLVAGVAIYNYGLQHGWSQQRIDDWLSNSIGAQFVYSVMAEALLMLIIFGMMRFLQWSWRTIGLTRPQLKQLLLGVVAVVPYYLLYIVMVMIVTSIVPSLNVDQKQDIGFNGVAGPWELILTFVSLVVLPPLVEEIAMRGFMYTGLRQWLPKVAAALVVSGVFGAAHLAEGGAAGPLWIGAIDTFTLSLVLVFLREKTGNLWAGIVLHASKNGIAFVLLYIFKAG